MTHFAERCTAHQLHDCDDCPPEPRPARRSPGCDHRRADYRTRTVDIDNHTIVECAGCGEVVEP